MSPTAEIRNSAPGGFEGELALSQTKRGSTIVGIGRDEFAPYRTSYELWRGASLISEGMMTSVNLNFSRDTILIAGKDWIHYLQRRIYPFDPELYIEGDWINWPRRWPDLRGTHGPIQSANPVDVGIIVKELIQSMKFDPPDSDLPLPRPKWPGGADETPGNPDFVVNIPETEKTTKYVIYPGDGTTIFDHIMKLSEQTDKGFEFDILPMSREFKLWSPRREFFTQTGLPWYRFEAWEDELDGAVTAFDWTNEGPDATYLVGLGNRGKKVGAVWTDQDNVAEFGRYDLVYDFGEIANPDLLLQMLKDQNDLHPQKKLELTILNPEFLALNFYTGGRPRNLLGGRIFAYHDFAPYHAVNAEFRINAIKWAVDRSTNEDVSLELEMVYEP